MRRSMEIPLERTRTTPVVTREEAKSKALEQGNPWNPDCPVGQRG